MNKHLHGANASRGFTLIELLVVIAIIGILSSVVLASLNTAKYKANDAKRRSDLKSLQIALELYYSKHNAYPSTNNQWYGMSWPAVVVPDYIPGLVSDGDISKLPQDPQYPANNPQGAGGACSPWQGMYIYKSYNGTGYDLLDHCAANSNVVNTPSSDGLYDSNRPTWAWEVCSPGDTSPSRPTGDCGN